MITSNKKIRVYDDRSRGETYNVVEIVYEDDSTLMTKLDDSYDETKYILIDKHTREVLTKTLESYYAENFDEVVKVPAEIMNDLYRIMSGISNSFAGAEVFARTIPGMQNAHKFIIEYGNKNNVNLRGDQI